MSGNLQQMPRGWGKSMYNDLIRATEAPLPEPQVWVDSRGQLVLDVYLEWLPSGLWVRVDVKMQIKGGQGVHLPACGRSPPTRRPAQGRTRPGTACLW